MTGEQYMSCKFCAHIFELSSLLISSLLSSVQSDEISLNNHFNSTFALLKGAVGAQLVILATTPVLTQLYTEAEFGVLAVFVSLVTITQPFISGAYDKAIPIASSDSDSFEYLILFLVRATVIYFVLFSIYIYGVFQSIESLGGDVNILPFMSLVLVSWVLTGAVAQRCRAYRLLSVGRLVQAVALCSAQVLLSTLNVNGLLLGFVLGYGVGAIFLFTKLRFFWEKFYSALPVERNPEVEISKGKFANSLVSSLTLNVAGRELVPLVLAMSFDPGTVGLYYLAARIMAAPLALSIETFSRVIYRESAEKIITGGLPNFLASAAQSLFSIGLPFVGFAFIFSEKIFPLMFGEAWQLSGVIASIIVFWSFAAMIIVPLLGVYAVLGLQSMSLKFELVSFTLRGAVLLLAPIYFGFITVITLYTLVASLTLFGQLVYIFITLQINPRKLFRTFILQGLFVVATSFCVIQFIEGKSDITILFVASIYLLVGALRSWRVFQRGLV